MARPHKLTITPADAPLQTWAGLREDLETAETATDIREIYDELLAYHDRTWKQPIGFATMGLPLSPYEAAWGDIEGYLRDLPEEKQAIIVPVLDQTVRERPAISHIDL